MTSVAFNGTTRNWSMRFMTFKRNSFCIWRRTLEEKIYNSSEYQRIPNVSWKNDHNRGAFENTREVMYKFLEEKL